jgi:hypothetical protein
LGEELAANREMGDSLNNTAISVNQEKLCLGLAMFMSDHRGRFAKGHRLMLQRVGSFQK